MRTARVEGDGAASLVLSVLAERLAVCGMNPAAEQLPVGVTMGSFCSITRTMDELSVICPEGDVPDGVMCERGWRALKLEGSFDFSLSGILVSVAGSLAEAGVSIFAVSTYDTDYVLVKEEQLDVAASEQGHDVLR